MTLERRQKVLLEQCLGLAVFALLGYIIWFYFSNLYLPQPFFYNPSDIFMDWFNTAYWANNGGAYDVWMTIYPPLSFVFLKVFGLEQCYSFSEPSLARDCDWLGKAALFGFFFSNIAIAAWVFFKRDPTTALPRTIATGLGLPMLYALERGNLLIVTFTVFSLAVGGVMAGARLRWLFSALAVNFKPYLVVMLVPSLVRRQWGRFETLSISVIAIYLMSWAVYGEGAPTSLYRNITSYSGGFEAAGFLDLWYSTTYKAILSLITGPYPATSILGSWRVETAELLIPAYTALIQISLVLAIGTVFFRKSSEDNEAILFFCVALALISSEGGGYTQVFIIFLVFLAKWESWPKGCAIVLAYLLALPGDITWGRLDMVPSFSYLADRSVTLDFGVSVGMAVRPGFVLLICHLLSWEFLWKEFRASEALKFRFRVKSTKI